MEGTYQDKFSWSINDMYCNTAAVLRVDSVHKQGKNYNPDVYVENCEYIDAESQRWPSG